MQIVDAVEVHVLCVPCESGLPHPEVQVWSVDPFDGDATVALHRVQNGAQVTDVPLFHILEKKKKTALGFEMI